MEPSRNRAKSVVALPAVLGSKTVEPALLSSTRGSKACRPAKVRSRHAECGVILLIFLRVTESAYCRDYLLCLFNQCISTPAVTVTRITPVCPKCAAIKKSGKLSCCAPGGAWFNNCGFSSNSKTEHTWFEGVQACKNVVSLFSGKEESQFILVNQTIATQHVNDVDQQTIDSTLAVAYDVPTGNSKYNDQLLHIVVFISILFIMFWNIQTYP